MGRIKNFFISITSGLKYNVQDNYKYIQMSLPVQDITRQFEASLTEKIENNIIHADVREAKPVDLDSIIELHDKSWKSAPMPYHQLNKEKILKLFDDPEIKFLIAGVDSIDSGFIVLYFTGDKNEIGVIAGLGVIPELQRKGLGTILGMAAWDYFKKRDVKELRCKIYKDNKISYNFVKNLGFREYEGEIITWKF
ncbi:MAG: GNAT family N-acetyltransferase [Candidatus Hodarchaeota archaeon]